MANMSYCKFENTYKDLQDCYGSMEDPDLSKSEKRFKNHLILLSIEIAVEYGEEVGAPIQRIG